MKDRAGQAWIIGRWVYLIVSSDSRPGERWTRHQALIVDAIPSELAPPACRLDGLGEDHDVAWEDVPAVYRRVA